MQVKQVKQMIQHNSTSYLIVVLTVLESNNSLIYPSIIISISNCVLNSPDKTFTKDHYPLLCKDIEILYYNYCFISTYYLFIVLVINEQLNFINKLLCTMLICSPPGKYFNFRIIYLEKENHFYPLKMYVLTVSKVPAKILDINSDLANASHEGITNLTVSKVSAKILINSNLANASHKVITNLNQFLYLYIKNE